MDETTPVTTETAEWPPPDADPVDTADLYARLAERGFRYGPAFRGLRAAWRRGDELFAEIALDPGLSGAAASYLLHPALFDGALHTTLLPAATGPDAPRVPFVWRGVRLGGASGARELRVRVAPDGANAVSLTVTDGEGRPVASVASLALRAPGGGRSGAGAALLRLDWTALARPSVPGTGALAFLGTDHLGVTGALKAAGRRVELYPSLRALDDGLRAGDAVPETVVVSCTDEAAEVRAATQRALVLIQEWLADERLAGSRLVFVTQGAVAVRDGDDVPDLAGAAVWGMVRSAQSEHPGRFALVDLDDTGSSGPALAAAVDTGEAQLAVRDGRPSRPRLTRVPPAATSAASPRWDPAGTVLVTGGLGALGALVARRLVREHGVRRLLLLGRRGDATPGAAGLAAELNGLGADVDIAACDAADRPALERVLAAIPAERPLVAVVHAAGVVDDGTVTALTPRRFERVLRPKADAALNLHELTEHLPGCELVLFSSVSGIAGGAGQANYAAANAFLDALAHRRRATGLPGLSLAWGLWEDGMGTGLGAADLTRLRRSGLAPLTADQGLDLLDAALRQDRAVLAPVRLDESALRAGPGALPEVMADLAVSGRTVRPSDGPDLRERLAHLSGAEREDVVLEFVRAQVADVLGHSSPDGLDPAREFGELGMDSLTTVELNRRLAARTGLRLPATVAFDHPSAARLAGHLHRLLS
ncbi:type I polyketide synthase [Actinomadura syzygii]|uniref:SDR family NAD(P)-dependent oxidoreductase n=1 Tax=Actinomadura syzygii TaxID=1427538 RepID=A0A5D0UC29_9ACTN|nr:type I polyketide synthase [Actinomadura syzygii]TYC16091.1 SDR family NAD(P)-dependent oxidoreductase [Actinomadura syzygii]